MVQNFISIDGALTNKTEVVSEEISSENKEKISDPKMPKKDVSGRAGRSRQPSNRVQQLKRRILRLNRVRNENDSEMALFRKGVADQKEEYMRLRKSLFGFKDPGKDYQRIRRVIRVPKIDNFSKFFVCSFWAYLTF